MEFLPGFKDYTMKIRYLNNQIERLRTKRYEMQGFIDADEVGQDARTWVTRAENTIKELEEAVKNLEAQKKESCFTFLCSSSKSLDHLGKEAAQSVGSLSLEADLFKLTRKRKVEELELELVPEKEHGSTQYFEAFPIERGPIQSSKNRFEAFVSRQATLGGMMNALKDPRLKIIGVYGMAGVGKTTLVKEVARRTKEESLFDEVTMETLSRNLNIKQIQGKIADALGLKFDEESVFLRAKRLKKWLKRGHKSLLLILDDVRNGQTQELEEIGIAFEGSKSIASDEEVGPLMQNAGEIAFQKLSGSAVRFKILLTSTTQQALIDMKTESMHNLQVLPDQEAIQWFQKMVGGRAKDRAYQNTVNGMVKNCAGFPVAISAIAAAVELRTFSSLLDDFAALGKETNPITTEDEKITSVYSTIQLSYSMLKKPKLQSLFQLCALLPQGSDIHVSDLLRYNSGLRIASSVSTLQKARKCVNKLKDAGLLLGTGNDEVVKMHDVVRDIAIGIAYEEKRVFIIEDQIRMDELLEQRKLNSCTAISLPYSSIYKLPNELECPRLKLLILLNKNPSFKVPDTFFKKMRELLMLELAGMSFPSLPSSFTYLGKLQMLSFNECELNDIAMIGNLNQLDTLKILSSDIQRLPLEVGRLTRLKSLDLSNCPELNVIPGNIISGLSYLEELLMQNSFDRWGVEGNASLSELKSLSGLTALDVHIRSVHVMPPELFSDKLNRYKILIGEIWDWSGKYEKERMLKLKLTKGIHLDRGVKLLLQKTEDLFLDELQGIKTLLYEVNDTGFPQLKNLYVQNGSKIQFIINSMEVAPQKAFPILESLFLQNLINLEKICHGQIEEECFRRLKIVSVKCCDRLKNLFPFSVTKMLVQLQEIKVSKCKSIEQIVAEERDQTAGTATGKTEFGQLRSLTVQLLPELSSFCSKEKSRSVYQLEPMNTRSRTLFNEKVMFPVLENLRLTSINFERLWENSSYCCRTLTSLYIEGCINLEHLFSSSVARSLLQLKSFEITDCKGIREIIVPDEADEADEKEEGKGKEKIGNMFFPQLNSLKMKNLVNLVRFSSEIDFLEFRSLKVLEIENCPQLKEFVHKENDHLGAEALFNAKVAFPELENLKISHLETVEMLWHSQLHTDSFSKLKEVKIGYCNEMSTIIPSNMMRTFQALETLIVVNCDSVQHIFESLDIEVATQRRESHLPKLKHVYVRDCWSLKSLFPESVAKGLAQLVDLSIVSCGLEQVVSADEGLNQHVNKFSFPEVRSLTLLNLPELKCFYPAAHETEWPKLKRLKTYHCGQEEVLGMEEHQSSDQKPLVLLEKVVRNLEELSISSKHKSIICNHREFNNLERLELLYFDSKGNFSDEGDANEKNLVSLPNASHTGEKNSQLSHVLPKLNTLKVRRCDGLISLGSFSESLQNLITLDLWQCKSTALITSSVARNLVQLIKMRIRDCVTVREVVAKEKVDAKNTICFTKLKCLVLHYLPNLTSFCSEDYNFNFPSLEQVIVRQCPSLKIFCRGLLSTPQLHRVQLSREDYKGFWDGNLNSTIFQLHKNTARYYEPVHLKLHEFLELEEIWNTVPQGIVDFKRLKFLEVYKCNNLRYILTASMVEDLVQLQQIKVKYCDVIEEIIRDDKSTTNNIMFPQLNFITVKSCLRLACFYLGSFALECPNLKEVTLVDCQKMIAFATTLKQAPSAKPFFSNKVSFPSLKDLTVVDMGNMQRIWDDQLEMISFFNLKHVKVQRCWKLSNVFRLNMLERLQRLKYLQIMECASLEEIFEPEFTEAETNTKFVFPQVTYLNLSMLPKLKCFYSGLHITEWPLLKKMDVYGCDKMEMFASENLSSHETKGQHPLFWIHKETFPCLEELRLESNATLKEIWHGQLPEGYFKLKVMELINCPALTVLPSYFFRSLSNLENFSVSDASINEMFLCEELSGDKNLEGGFAQLTVLRISKLHEMKHLWNENFNPRECFYNMRVLQVQDCSKLNMLVPSSVSFENLTTLEVSRCQGLKHLFAHSTAESLVQLMRMSISDCKMIEEIVACSGEEVKEGSIFSQLKYLGLSHLPNLASFSSGNFNLGECLVLQVQDCDKLNILVPSSVSFENLTTLEVSRCQGLRYLFAQSTAKSLVQLTRMNVTDCKMIKEIVACSVEEAKEDIAFARLKYLGLSCLPNLESFSSGKCIFLSLETVTLRQCPKMKTLPQERFNAPKLQQQVYSIEAGDEGHWESDKNTTIQLLFMETVEYRGNEYATLSDFSMLMEIRNWNPQGTLDFKNLKFLKVYNCRNLRYPFNPSMAMDLVNLEKLEIHDCEMMEEIIMTKGLPKKERMRKKMFPKLLTLLLISLPNLTTFCSGNYLEFPFLKELWIQSCPMLKTFISSSVIKKNSTRNLHTDSTVLLDEKVAFPSLEKLGIIDMGNLKKICNDQISMDSFSKIKVLKLIGLPKQPAFFPSGFFLSLFKLERLVVHDASFTEIFQCEGIEARELASFSDLRLSKLPELTHLSKEESLSQPGILFQNLRTLKVLECPRLEYLDSSTVSFENLTILEISRCHGLRNLITASTAKSMVQLKRMKISDCKMLEGIVGNAGGRAKDSIIFKRLEHLRLQSLPVLQSFCSGYYSFEFPSLVELAAVKCPELSVFTEGKVTTRLLKRVCLTEGGDISLTNEDLNATIKELYIKKARNYVKELEFLQWTLSDLWRPSTE